MKTGSGIPPWHLWGGTQQIDAINAGAAFPSQPSAGQLAKISYKRPDTWHWVFAAKVLAAASLPLVGNVASIGVFFDLTIGVGRAQVQFPSFEAFSWTWHGVSDAPIGSILYSTEVFGPNRVFDTSGPAPADVKTNSIKQFQAQDINIACRVLYNGTVGVGAIASVEVSAFFAPKTHIRPDWDLEHFMGGETGGS